MADRPDPYEPIRQARAELIRRRDELRAIVDPAREERNGIVEKMQPLEAEAKRIFDTQIKPHLEELGALDREIGALTRALPGTRVLRHEEAIPVEALAEEE